MITIGSDHGGFVLKEKIVQHLADKNISCRDIGTDSEQSCDYPLYAHKVCQSVLDGESKFGILICGTGIGMSIAANKIKGIRAALCNDCYSARMTREHNDANVLVLGARVIGDGHAAMIVDTFLTTEFSQDERHLRRIRQIEQDV